MIKLLALKHKEISNDQNSFYRLYELLKTFYNVHQRYYHYFTRNGNYLAISDLSLYDNSYFIYYNIPSDIIDNYRPNNISL